MMVEVSLFGGGEAIKKREISKLNSLEQQRRNENDESLKLETGFGETRVSEN